MSLDAIVDRALELADAEGLPAVTIRRLAQLLGVTPMALYWYVKNKDELLDAMGDRIFATLDVDLAAITSRPSWDEQLEAVVTALVRTLRAHPTCLDLVYRRIFGCPQGRAITELTLGLLRRAGFSPRESADLATYALQTAMMLVSSEPGAEVGADPEEQSRRLAQKRARLTELPAEQYPYIREMADDLLQCDDLPAFYAFGVRLFVDGARASLAAR